MVKLLNNLMKEVYCKFGKKILPLYHVQLEKAIGSSKSVLDIGCGSNSQMHYFSNKFYSVGIEKHKPSINESKRKKIHNKYFHMDAMDIRNKFKSNSFDCVLASDLIEHLTKKEGLKLIKMMDKIAKNKVIVFTPNGFAEYGGNENDNECQVHKSGWNVNEMGSLGFNKIIGINGLKLLRDEKLKVKIKPYFLGELICQITQIFINNKPELASQILCIKENEKKK